MKFFAEMETRKSDGRYVIYRLKATGEQNAVDLAYSMAVAMFSEEKAGEPHIWKIGVKNAFINDYREFVRIYPICYGAASQVKEGTFVL